MQTCPKCGNADSKKLSVEKTSDEMDPKRGMLISQTKTWKCQECGNTWDVKKYAQPEAF